MVTSILAIWEWIITLSSSNILLLILIVVTCVSSSLLAYILERRTKRISRMVLINYAMTNFNQYFEYLKISGPVYDDNNPEYINSIEYMISCPPKSALF